MIASLILLVMCSLLGRVEMATTTKPEMIEQIANAYTQVKSLHTQYDLYIRTQSDTRRVLSVEEAMSGEQFFNRIVDWYDQTLYQFDHEEWDPLLNSYYWSPNQYPNKEVRVQETERECTFSDALASKEMSLGIQGYLGWCGLIVPKRRQFLADNELILAAGYDARHYYFPFCLRDATAWRVLSSEKTKCSITRTVGEYEDTIWFQTWPTIALIERHVTRPNLENDIYIRCGNFVKVSDRLSLPRTMTVRVTPGYEMEYKLNHLSAEPPSEVFTVSLKPGTLISNADGTESMATPGGVDFLDFTVARMRRAQNHEGDRTTGLPSPFVGYGVTILLLIVVIAWVHKQRRHSHV